MATFNTRRREDDEDDLLKNLIETDTEAPPPRTYQPTPGQNRGIGAGAPGLEDLFDDQPDAPGTAFAQAGPEAPGALAGGMRTPGERQSAGPPPIGPPPLGPPPVTPPAAPPTGGLVQSGPAGAGGLYGGMRSDTSAPPGGPPGDRVPGGASARYGTDNIPGAENLTWGDTSRLRGFNTNEWGEGGTEGYEDSSIKNSFGKIASRYNPSPSGLREMMNDPDFQRLFPEATLVEGGAGDKIDFGDGRPVDVLISADPNADTAEGWAFQTMDEEGGGGPPGVGGDLMGLLGGGDDATAPSRLDDIQAQIEALMRGENPMEDEELTRMIGQT